MKNLAGHSQTPTERKREYNRRYYAARREELRAYQSKYNKKNAERIRAFMADYRAKNGDSVRRKRREQYAAYYKPKVLATNRRCVAERIKSDIVFRISTRLRSRLGAALKRCPKKGSAIRDLGCSIEQLKIYLASKFSHGMSWENYGRNGWHIDHIKPLSLFDLTDANELRAACHFTNLQPLWALDNIRKGASAVGEKYHVLT